MGTYQVLIQAQLVTTDIQGQLNAIQSKIKPINIAVNSKSSANEVSMLNTKVLEFRRTLETLRSTNVDAFKTTDIDNQGKAMDDLVTAFSRGETGLADVNDGMKNFKGNLGTANEGLRTTIKNTDNFTTSVGKAVTKIALWGIATTALYGSLQQLKDGVKYVEDLNKQMTSIGLVTGQTVDQLSGLASQYNDMAKQYGTDTLSMTEGALEFIRQGKSAEETTQLLANSTMMSKLGNLSAADATTRLTAVLNAYNISAKDSIKVVDSLTALDNSYAVSVDSVSAGMEESASFARQAGVSYSDLAAQITIVEHITQQSGDTVGNALLNYFLGRYGIIHNP
jgi:hypothetical protein